MSTTLPSTFADTSVSHGTMLAEHLIPAFAAILPADDPLRIEAEALDLSPANPAVEEVLVALFDALDAIAPTGTYFGAHPGDGSDFGFWSDVD
jgi:hypothetical protein